MSYRYSRDQLAGRIGMLQQESARLRIALESTARYRMIDGTLCWCGFMDRCRAEGGGPHSDRCTKVRAVLARKREYRTPTTEATDG